MRKQKVFLKRIWNYFLTSQSFLDLNRFSASLKEACKSNCNRQTSFLKGLSALIHNLQGTHLTSSEKKKTNKLNLEKKKKTYSIKTSETALIKEKAHNVQTNPFEYQQEIVMYLNY